MDSRTCRVRNSLIVLIAVCAPVAFAADSDGDGVDDSVDVCCNTPPGVPVDADGGPVADLDEDCDIDLADFAIMQSSFTGPDLCTPEVCDGLDNDCNCLIDDMGTLTCGVGECYREVLVCSNGVLQTCIPGTPTAELCDGLDNDCDPGTPDGYDEPWFHQPCDGPDMDLCEEGIADCDMGVYDCDDHTGSTFDTCNGVDDDCHPGTPDGFHEPWYDEPCDGPDSDLCNEGNALCQGGAYYCSDATGNNLELCNGSDDDCDPATPDGIDEAWYAQLCDGPDSDLCEEGTATCQAGAYNCSDNTSSTLDLCNGVDDDCNPATPDGSDESTLGTPCDGGDIDLCEEGTVECSGGSLNCTDYTSDSLDLCNGADDDCNPATQDGFHETWYGQPCDGPDSDLCEEGTGECVAGSGMCSDNTGDTPDLCNGADDDCNPATPDGADDPSVGVPCDGPDADMCEEGTIECSGGALTCNDTTGDTLDFCNGVDDDCNPATFDGFHEWWIGDPCDGPDTDLCEEGTLECRFGSQYCNDETGDDLDYCNGFDDDCNPATPDGFDDPSVGMPCDGMDTDYCEEGQFVCMGGGLVCDDYSDDTLEMCDDWFDNDCDGDTDCDDPECDGEYCDYGSGICSSFSCVPI